MDPAPGARRSTAPVESTPEVDDLQPGVSKGAAARRRRQDAARVPARVADDDPVRGRPLDGRGVGRVASPSRAAAPGETVVRVHDPAAGRGVASRRPRGTPPVPAFTIRLDPLPDEDAMKLGRLRRARGPRGATSCTRSRNGPGQPALPSRSSCPPAEQVEEPEELPGHGSRRSSALASTALSAPGSHAASLGVRAGAVDSPATCSGLVLADDPVGRVGLGGVGPAGRSSSSATRTSRARTGFRHARLSGRGLRRTRRIRRRRELHARVGEAYERLRADETEGLRRGPVAAFPTRRGVHEKAWSYSLAAAERARAKSANADACGVLSPRARRRSGASPAWRTTPS